MPGYEYQTLNIVPGTVMGDGWSGIEHALVPDVGDTAGFGRFSPSNSAVVGAPAAVVPSQNEQGSPAEGSSSGAGSAEPSEEAGGVPPTDTPDSSESTTESSGESGAPPATNEPAPEPAPEVGAPAPEASAAGDVGALALSFISRVRERFALVFETIDGVPESTPAADQGTVSEDATAELPQGENGGEIIPPETNGTPAEPQQAADAEAGLSAPSTVPTTRPGTESDAPAAANCDRCVRHALEFADFTVGSGFDEQQITNMQVRVSLAARPHPEVDRSNEQISIEYFHHGFWIDGGTISIDEELSNATNGGHQLFAFPLYSDWDELQNIRVRLTYMSDGEHVSDIFLDSLWLEVESIDNAAFTDPNPGPVRDQVVADARALRERLPEGYRFDVVNARRDFSFNERPEFTFRIARDRRDGFFTRLGNGIRGLFGLREEERPLRVRVQNPEWRDIARVTEQDGTFTVDIPRTRHFTPGTHVLTLEVEDNGTTEYVDYEFSWGVLALNVDKSIYSPNETAYVQMGVVDDKGHTLCDAALELTITAPSGDTKRLSTADGSIEFGDECAGDSFTTSPDYETHYTVDDAGTYTMKLTATTGNGTHTQSDTFEVRDAVPFDVVRTGPTRIYPPALYPVTLTVTANEAYKGPVIELVPQSFQVFEEDGSEATFRTHEIDDTKQLIWDVDLEAGEILELSYAFDAPDISPEFYLLGPLTVGGFAEIREWQIAADAPDRAVIVQSVLGAAASSTSYSATFGAAPTIGNVIIMVATHRDGPSAFNQPAYLTQAVLSNAAVEIDIGIWYKVVDTASTTYTITKTGGNETGRVYLLEVSGLDTAALLNATSSNDQTGSNSLTAYTGASGTTTQYAFGIAAISFGDNDFTTATSGAWTSDSVNPYTQLSFSQWATGSDGALGIARVDVNTADSQGATLRLLVGGTEQRNSVLALFKIQPQITTVNSQGNQIAAAKINTANNYIGGAFTLLPNTGSTSVTSITVTETGTTNAQNDLSNIKLYYELDSTAPYDCASVSYDGTETRYGATSTSFSSANGSSTFSGSVSISSTSAMCVYPMLDVDSSAVAGDTIELQIATPSSHVVVDSGSSTPGTAVSISDTTEIVIGFTPNQPALAETPAFAYMRSTTTTPTLGGFAATDVDGDALEYQLIIDDDQSLTSPATTTFSGNYPSDTGWSAATFASGATTTYRIPSSVVLTSGTTYWWAVRARDPGNTNTWSATSTPRSITIGSSIAVPEWLQTTDEQFATGTTMSNATTTGSDSVTLASTSSSVSLLNAWSLGATKTISAGTNRMLIVAIHNEDAGIDAVNTVSYGGRTLTEIYDQTVGAGFSDSVWVGYLNEADIATSSGTTITPTWTPGTPVAGDIIIHSAVFSGVDQTNPIRDFSSNALTSGANITPTASTTALAGDMALYAVGAGDSVTYTPATGYTEGTDNNTCTDGCSSATAYKAVTADGTELPTATLSGTANRVLITQVVLSAAAAVGTITSSAVDFDWVSNQTDWGEVTWNVTEPSGSDTRLYLYYGSSCSTIVPNSALPGNSSGFGATSSPISIAALSTSTYNQLCVRMELDEGTATSSLPTLNDWNVSWEPKSLFDQVAYRWYANHATSTTPTDTWPVGATGEELGQNQPIVSSYPTKTGDVLRLRMGVSVSSIAASGYAFKLQFAEGSSCSAGQSWQDVGDTGSSTALWRGYNNASLTDGATLSSSTLTSTDDFESYEEESPTATLPNTISVSDQGEWDFVLENRATPGTSYCFRMVLSDGSTFADYTNYPLLVTNQSPSITSIDALFDNEKVGTTTPSFEFTGTDPEGEELDYQVQISTDVNFGSTVVDTDSATNLTGFTNLVVPADKSPFNDSEAIRLRLSQAQALTNGTTYWWRVRTVDPNGSVTYGAWSTARSFTIDTSVTISTWFQTTEEQFDTDTLVGTDATGSDLVQFASGSTTGTTTSTALDFDDASTGNAWGSFSFTETGAANNILYHIEYYDGDSWELIPNSALSGNSAGYDTSPVSLIDLDTEIYNQIRIRANFLAGSPTLLDWTVTWGLRVSVPTHLLLFDNEKTGTTTPTFTFYTTDPQGDDLEYEFSWSTDNTFVAGSTTVNSSSSPGFTNVTNGGDTNPFDSGDTISYQMQSALTNGTTYWWRTRARDPLAGNSYSFWSEPWSFTVDTTATTSTWFQTTEEQFDTDTLVSLEATTTDSVSTIPPAVTVYNFAGITSPSATHVARDFEVDVDLPTDPPTVDEIDTLTSNGTTAGTPNLRTGLAGYASDAEASSAQYTQIATSNNVRWTITDPGLTDQAVFWARFHINESANDISEINVLLEGYQNAAAEEAWLGIWRPGSTTPYWQWLTDSQQTGDFNYTGSITANFDQYLDGNNDIHIIFFNADDDDSLFVDYVEVEVVSDAAETGTITSSPLDFDDGSGPAWGSYYWSDSEPGSSSINYQLQYLTSGGTWVLIPDSALSGNAAGFTTPPINLKLLNTTTYNEIRAVGNFACSGVNCPTLNDWTIEWSRGFTVSGTAFEYDRVSSTTSGTVAVAVNGVLQIGKTGTISNGSWSIDNVTFFAGDIITVFVSGAADANKAIAVTEYDGTPDMSGLRLYKRHLSIGSDDRAIITNADIGLFDIDDDTDLFYDVIAGNDLALCAGTGCGDASLIVLANNTYAPESNADAVVHDVINNGTITLSNNVLRVSGSWDNNATTSLGLSDVIMTATSSTESVDSTGAISSTFNNLTFGETSGTATWNLLSSLDVDGVLSVSRGTVNRNAVPITLGGNLTTGANGFWGGIGTTTFDGTASAVWTDQNATKQNIGYVVVDGTTKTLLLGSNASATSMTIGANDTLDANTPTSYDLTLLSHWTNNNVFTARTGEVIFAATSTARVITPGSSSFYDMTMNGVGGAWSFSGSTLTVGNDLTIATGTITLPTGTTTVQGSFLNTGGLFQHNNGEVRFTSTGSETITLGATAFTNGFYDLTFNSSGGTWNMTDASATTSNNVRILAGTPTFPGTRLSIGGSFINSGGSFNGNNAELRFYGSSAKTITAGGGSFASLRFDSTSTSTMTETNVTALGSFTVNAGTTTLPTGTLTLGGSFTNASAIDHSSGTVLFNSTDQGETVSLGVSALYNATFNSATGGWTVSSNATTSNALTITSAGSFTLQSGRTLAVGGTFTNSANGASTTWNGSTLMLLSGTTYLINASTTVGDRYDTLTIGSSTKVSMWNSSATTTNTNLSAYLYSQDHAAVDGDLTIYGAYTRTSGTEYWNAARDFDGTALATSSQRQVDVRFASGASAALSSSTLSVVGTSTATTTVASLSGTYTVNVSGGTTTLQYYDMTNLGSTGLTLGTSTIVSSFGDGRLVPGVGSGSALTVSSSTIDANPALQIERVEFSTTTAISAVNVTQTGGAPASYWWFRNSTGNLDGEAFDVDTGDPGSIRWDDSSYVITASGTVYSDAGVTPMGAPTCDGVTQNVRIIVNAGSSTHDGTCSPINGTFSIPGVTFVGDPTLTIFLNTNGGARGAVVTKTPAGNLTDIDIYQNRIITRHEDAVPLTISDMAKYDEDNDSDLRFSATTSPSHALTVRGDTELFVFASTTFTPGGTVTLEPGGTGNAYDATLHIDNNATATAQGTETWSVGGRFQVDSGGVFVPASSTVTMTATSTGKTISSPGTIDFNTLSFTGAGSWDLVANLSVADGINLNSGTFTGSGNIDIAYGSFGGNGTLAFTGGTTTIARTNTLGSTTPWQFYNLTLGSGSVSGTTTRGDVATTTVLNRLTVSAAHTLSAGASRWDLRGSSTPFVVGGTFTEGTSFVRYSGSGATTLLSDTYYDLDLNAASGTPTYSTGATGINILGSLMVGGQSTTTASFDAGDPIVSVTGNVYIRPNGTFVGSNSASFSVLGNWDNDGTYTSSGGTVTFSGSGAQTISAGASSLANVVVGGSGTHVFNENATTTAAFTITQTGGMTVNSGVRLAVGGVFQNNVNGAQTTWTGSTLHLYSGTSYDMNAKSTDDTYGTLSVGPNTDPRMWNSTATSITVDSTGSLYSMDHANATGALNIYGEYGRTSGTDYWSYAYDFDGTPLGGASRKVDVAFSNGATAYYTGGGLFVMGDSAASTTVTNQGSGTYTLTLGGTASTTMRYYEMRNMASSGMVFTGTPNVITISNGDYLVSQSSGSAITVGGTAITQNPAKTFSNNRFATSTAISAVNVTATGTTISSWRFTNEVGNLAGEAYDVDPGGDPGYVVWSDSASNITIAGRVYSDEGTTVSGVCDDVTTNIRLVVAGVTTYDAVCESADGDYTIPGVTFSANDTLTVFINGETEKAATVSVDPVSSIADMHLYENCVILRHENTDPITIADIAAYDSTDDADVPFTAVDAGTDTLTLPANRKLIVWSGKTFAPAGNVTVSGGGGGAAYDGTLELFTNAVFTAAGTESHSVGGSLILGTNAVLTAAQSTFTLTTTGAARTVDVNQNSFYNLTMNGSGSWSVTDAAMTVSNDMTITAGAITLPTGTTTVGGSFANNGGSFTQTTGTLALTATASGKTLRMGGHDVNRLVVNGSGGAWTMTDTNATTTLSTNVIAGSLTLPSGTFRVGSDFTASGTITHNNGTLRLTGTSTSGVLRSGGSTLGSVVVAGSGSYAMTDSSLALAGSLTISSGSMTFATNTLSIAGSLTATGGTFSHASGTVLMNSTDQGETVSPGSSRFYNLTFQNASGGWTVSSSATTTNNLTLASAASFRQASSTTFEVNGVFTNLVGGSATNWDGSTLLLATSTSYAINLKSSTGDRYNILAIASSTDISMWNSNATTTTTGIGGSLYSMDHGAADGELSVFGDYERRSGTDYWNYAIDFDGAVLVGGARRAVTVRHAQNATTTVLDSGTLNIVGDSTASTTVTNQGSGTYSVRALGGTLNASQYRMRNLGISGMELLGTTTISSLSNGDWELAVSSGTLITVSSSTVNANASAVHSNVRFATTTAITGANVTLTGTTSAAWTFTTHSGNLAGEAYDIDGGDSCGSIRWSDSSCLLIQQAHYRWRNDDGGEGAPNSEWYSGSWSKRQRVVVTNADASTYTNTAVRVTVPFDSDMQTTFSDLRFTSADGTTLLNHWIESYSASTQATVWVEVPSLTASADTSLFMYYGNTLASDASNGTTTFVAFDDFEDDNISEYSGDTSLFNVGTALAYDRTYGLDASGNENSQTTDGIYRTSSTTVSQGETIRYFQYVNTSTGGSDEPCTLFGVQSPGSNNNNYAVCFNLVGVDKVLIAENVSSDADSGTILSSSTITYATGWHEVEVDWRTNNTIYVSVYRNGSLVATTSATDSSYTTGGIGFTYWFQHGGWDSLSSRPYVTTDPSVRFGVEQVPNGATWMAALDTFASSFTASTTARVRFGIENTGLAVTDQQFRLEYAEKGVAPSCESVSGGSYTAVPVASSCGSSPVCMTNSSNVTDLASTTDQLGGVGQYTYGQSVENASNKTGSLNLGGSTFTEVEYAIVPTVNATAGTYCLRVTDDGTALDGYTRVAEMRLRYNPVVTNIVLNGGNDIVLSPGSTTTVSATATITDQNGYADMTQATATIYRSGVAGTSACSQDNNNCYRIASSSCTMFNCAGFTCTLSCNADIYYFADPTDIGTYAAQDWAAFASVLDTGGGYGTSTSAINKELITLRALDVTQAIDYGSLESQQDTGAYNATTTIDNIGNDAIDISVAGTNLISGSSTIPVNTQKFATSTFTYSSCTTCSLLGTSTSNLEVDLVKPTSPTPVEDQVFWGISIPFGVAASAHQGQNTFYAIGD